MLTAICSSNCEVDPLKPSKSESSLTATDKLSENFKHFNDRLKELA